ncbi:MAG: T9SS type A sorting domain-containing protein [Bacteroidota bacterium]
MHRFLLLFLAVASLPIFSNGQTTGSFQLNIQFPQADYNENRNLYFYVPEDYDPNNAYKLLVGFRGGPNSNAGQFRDQLQPLSDSLNAIILCPENEAHFWDEEGRTKLLFQYSVDTAMALYNIDPDFIYLTGLSYGGRHAVIVAMDTDDGPIPNLRGVIPFAAGADSHLQPNYDSAGAFPPACICIGLSDSNTFINVANSLHNDLQSNGGASFLNEIPGVGHTVAFPSFPAEMMECLEFIEAQYEVNNVNNFPEINNEILVYPNPSNGTIYFSILNHSGKIKEIKLFNYLGQFIKNLPVEKREINQEDLPEGGVLYLSVLTEEGIITKKIILN